MSVGKRPFEGMPGVYYPGQGKWSTVPGVQYPAAQAPRVGVGPGRPVNQARKLEILRTYRKTESISITAERCRCGIKAVYAVLQEMKEPKRHKAAIGRPKGGAR